jgi:hypothetical protein
LLHVQMYITLIFSGKDKQKAFSRIGWLWATITSGDTCWNAALSKKLLCKREVRDTVQHISFPFCLTLGDQQLIFFAVPVSMKIEKFCGILLMSMLHYSRDYPEYFGPFFHAILFSWPSRNFAESFHQHGLVAGYFFWQCGFLACRRMSSCAEKLNWHTVGLSEKCKCVILLAMCLHGNPITRMPIHTPSHLFSYLIHS